MLTQAIIRWLIRAIYLSNAVMLWLALVRASNHGQPAWFWEAVHQAAVCGAVVSVGLWLLSELLTWAIRSRVFHIAALFAAAARAHGSGLYALMASYHPVEEAERNTWHLLALFTGMGHLPVVGIAGLVGLGLGGLIDFAESRWHERRGGGRR